MDDLSGTVVGDRYCIERAIGRGGMATVWLAGDAQHERMVAIKTLHRELAGAIGTDRFLQELRLTARLQHPSIVPILDSGVFDCPDGSRVPWYAMPFLQGESLRGRLDRGRQLSIEEALRITAAVGNALQAAHSQQIVHRDIKPENVFLVGDQVYIVDFGIARTWAATETERLTGTGLAIGTPAYMSPEQSTGETVDARSDQYSLAAVLYEMIAGEPPFTGSNARVIFARRLAEKPRPLGTVRSTVPDHVERATLRALERTPSDRFDSLTAFLAALEGRGAAQRHARPSRRRTFRSAVVAAGVIIVAGLAAWSMLSRDKPVPMRAVDPAVVALYERAVRSYDRRTPTGVADAIGTLSAVLARDSAYAPAWNALAKSYARAYNRGFRVPGTPADRLLPLGVAAVDRSLALDSTSADVRHAHFQLHLRCDPPFAALANDRRFRALVAIPPPTWGKSC